MTQPLIRFRHPVASTCHPIGAVRLVTIIRADEAGLNRRCLVGAAGFDLRPPACKASPWPLLWPLPAAIALGTWPTPPLAPWPPPVRPTGGPTPFRVTTAQRSPGLGWRYVTRGDRRVRWVHGFRSPSSHLGSSAWPGRGRRVWHGRRRRRVVQVVEDGQGLPGVGGGLWMPRWQRRPTNAHTAERPRMKIPETAGLHL